VSNWHFLTAAWAEENLFIPTHLAEGQSWARQNLRLRDHAVTPACVRRSAANTSLMGVKGEMRRFDFCGKIHTFTVMLMFAIFKVGLSYAGDQIAGI
jgi:hypothetical protein